MCEILKCVFKSKTVAAKLWDAARGTARKVTLEPAIILVAIMSGVGNGVKVQTNLQLWKVICYLEYLNNYLKIQGLPCLQ